MELAATGGDQGGVSPPMSWPSPSHSFAESANSHGSTPRRTMSVTPPPPPTPTVSSCSSRETTSTPPTSGKMHFDPIQGDADCFSYKVCTMIFDDFPTAPGKPDIPVAARAKSSPKSSTATIDSVPNPHSPCFSCGKDFADSASPTSERGPSEVAEVSEMFSGLCLSPESLRKRGEVELVCVSLLLVNRAARLMASGQGDWIGCELASKGVDADLCIPLLFIWVCVASAVMWLVAKGEGEGSSRLT